MLITILAIIAALYWLGLESNWLTIRLLADKEPDNRKTWDELKPYKVYKNHPFWLRHPDNMTPLCGWDWLNKRTHIIPVYKIELIQPGYKSTMTIRNDSIIKDVFRVYRNPMLKVKL